MSTLVSTKTKVAKRYNHRSLIIAAGIASAALASNALADGTFTRVLGGDFTWNGNGWTISGDTHGQTYPGLGGDGTEVLLAQPINGGRTLNISTAATNTTSSFTLNSVTLQQTQPGITRGLNINYQGGSNDAKFTLFTNLIQHIDAAGIQSGGGGLDGLQNAMVFNWRLAVDTQGTPLTLVADTNPTPTTISTLAQRGNIALKFDDSNISFNGLVVKGTKSVEFEQDTASTIWNMTGDISLEGTGQLRFRYFGDGSTGGLVAGTAFNNLLAKAPGADAYASLEFTRAAGTGLSVFQFNRTILDSNLFYDPNNSHVALGVIEVHGNRHIFAYDGMNNTSANGTSYTGIEGDASSVLNLTTSGTSWNMNLDVSATMLGKITIADGWLRFNANGALGAQGVAKRQGAIDLNITPLPTDKFAVERQGALVGDATQFAALTVGQNLEVQPGGILVHETLGASAAEAATVNGLTSANKAIFGIASDVTDYNITVGGTSIWAGMGVGRDAKRWNSGVITAEGDFTIMTGMRGAVDAPIFLGNGTAAGGIAVINATGTTNKVNVDLVGRVNFTDDTSDFSQAVFTVKSGTEVRVYADNALAGGQMIVEAGGLASASSTGNGGSTAVGAGSSLHLKTGSLFQVNGKDPTGANAGMNGLGTITREPNITFWANHGQALNGTQWNHANIQSGDIFRIENSANDIVNLEKVAAGVTYVVRNGNVNQGYGMFLDGGGIFTDGSSRTIGTSTAGVGSVANPNTILFGATGTTFGASTPVKIYDNPNDVPTVNVTGTQTLTINLAVRPDAAATAAGVNTGKIIIGSTSPVERLPQMGTVLFNGAFVTPGSVEKINHADLIFNNADTFIGGDLIAGGGAPNSGVSPNVKFGNNNVSLSGGVVSGTVIAGSLILKPFTKTDLNIDTNGFNGTAGQATGRLGVDLKIVIDGAPSADGRRLYVDRRDTNSAGAGLITFNKITLLPNSTLTVDEANTDVWINSPTILGDFTIDRSIGGSDNFDLTGVIDAAAPVTITHGLVNAANTTATGIYNGTVGANITFNNVRGQVSLNDNVNFNGTIHTQNVPAGGDSWVRIVGGASGANGVTGSGQINLGGSINGTGEDLFIYVNDHADTPITNSTDLRINVVANQLGQIVSDRIGTDLAVPGNTQVNNIHLNEGSSLFLQQNQDTTLRAGIILEGNATVRMNDGDATANGRIIVGDVSGAYTLNANTESVARTLAFNGNATNSKIVIGSTGNESAVEFKTGANLPAVEAGALATIAVVNGESATVSSIKTANPVSGAVYIGGTLAIRDTGSAATSTTSKLADLTLSGGKLDLGNGRVIVDYATGATPYTTLRDQIVNARNGGNWDGAQGITSSMVAAATNRTAVGIGESSVVLGLNAGETATWFGETVDADSILMRGTILGDTDLDGAVTFVDLLKVSANFGATGMLWTDGDSDYDGAVTFVDLLGVAANFGGALPTHVAGASAEFNEALTMVAQQVPEPSTLGLIGLTAGLLGRRRRK